MDSNIEFSYTDGLDRQFIPYKGWCVIKEDGTSEKDTLTAFKHGPFEIITIHPENSRCHISYNLRDKDGNILLPKGVRKITCMPEGYYIIEDNNEDELTMRGDVIGGFNSLDYKSVMNVMTFNGKLLSNEGYDKVIPEVGRIMVSSDNRWIPLDFNGDILVSSYKQLKLGCILVRQDNGFDILTSQFKRLVTGCSSLMWTSNGIWTVHLMSSETEKTFYHGQGGAVISYAHEILIRPDVVALFEKNNHWYILDSTGQTTECFTWKVPTNV